MAYGPIKRSDPGAQEALQREIDERPRLELSILADMVTMEDVKIINAHQQAFKDSPLTLMENLFPLTYVKAKPQVVEILEANSTEYDEAGEDAIFEDSLLKALVSQTGRTAESRAKAIRTRRSLVALYLWHTANGQEKVAEVIELAPRQAPEDNESEQSESDIPFTKYA